MKKVVTLVLIAIVFVLVGCSRKADVVSHNISKEADEFRVYRRVVFYNSIQDTYILELKGYCSVEVESSDQDLAVTCLVGPDKYQKHFLGLSDNVTWTAEQLDSSNVSAYKYELIFKPESIIPITIDVE